MIGSMLRKATVPTLATLVLVVGCDHQHLATEPDTEAALLPGSDNADDATGATAATQKTEQAVRIAGGGYECENVEDCYKQCPEPRQNGGTTVCSCQAQGGGGFWCQVSHYGPADRPDGDCKRDGGGGVRPTSQALTFTKCRPAKLTLECPSTPQRGSSVTCVVSVPGNSVVSSIAWGFSGEGTATSKVGGSSWTGNAVATGTVTVRTTVDGESVTASAEIQVQPRAWEWDVSTGWDDGAVDACANWDGDDSDAMGLTVAVGCGRETEGGWFDRQGYEVTQGTGPWAKLYYVINPAAPVALAAALRPQLRAKRYFIRQASPLRSLCRSIGAAVTVKQANTSCDPLYSSAYNTVDDYVRAHEEAHLQAGRLDEDLYVAWESLIGTDSATVSQDALKKARDLHRAMATAQAAVDSGSSTQRVVMWYYNGTWERAVVKYGGHD